jgi:hypothetical protein
MRVMPSLIFTARTFRCDFALSLYRYKPTFLIAVGSVLDLFFSQ